MTQSQSAASRTLDSWRQPPKQTTGSTGATGTTGGSVDFCFWTPATTKFAVSPFRFSWLQCLCLPTTPHRDTPHSRPHTTTSSEQFAQAPHAAAPSGRPDHKNYAGTLEPSQASVTRPYNTAATPQPPPSSPGKHRLRQLQVGHYVDIDILGAFA